MKTAEYIALSAATMMLTALGIDIMLPVFGEVRQHFGLSAESTATAQIISFFFMGQVAQIIFGVLSDRFGRLAVLHIGFPLYIISGVVATFAPSLTIMYIARFIAGMGASAVFSTTIAGVRDRFVGNQMAHILSLIFTVFLSTPVFAPFLGLAILHIATWRWVFLTPPLFAVIVFIWSLRLKESLPKDKRSELKISAIKKSLFNVVSDKVFLRYTSITTILFTGLSSWVASSEHIVSEIYKSPQLFAWIFGGMGLFMAVCTLTNSRLSIKYGAQQTLKWLLMFYTSVATILLACTFLFGNPPNIILFVVAIALLLGTNLAIEPNSSALAMEPMGNSAGLASSVYGTIFFFFGSVLSSVINNLMKETVMPLIISFFLIGVITLSLAISGRRLPKVSVE